MDYFVDGEAEPSVSMQPLMMAQVHTKSPPDLTAPGNHLRDCFVLSAARRSPTSCDLRICAGTPAGSSAATRYPRRFTVKHPTKPHSLLTQSQESPRAQIACVTQGSRSHFKRASTFRRGSLGRAATSRTSTCDVTLKMIISY